MFARLNIVMLVLIAFVGANLLLTSRPTSAQNTSTDPSPNCPATIGGPWTCNSNPYGPDYILLGTQCKTDGKACCTYLQYQVKCSGSVLGSEQKFQNRTYPARCGQFSDGTGRCYTPETIVRPTATRGVVEP